MPKKPPKEIIEETIIKTEYSEVMQKSYIDYAMSVIVSRALPDVRDGLKPVQRRTLYDMYELNNKVRMIDVSDYMIDTPDAFLGFVSGIISQDHDLMQMYFDSFLRISNTEGGDPAALIEKLDKLSEMFNVTFILSVSLDESELPESLKDKILISL